MRSPCVRNAVSRSRWRSVSRENSISSKISGSGRNEIVVPVSFGDADRPHVALRHAARELLPVDLPVALDRRRSSHSESAFTTDTPTPWRPPETL